MEREGEGSFEMDETIMVGVILEVGWCSFVVKVYVHLRTSARKLFI